MKFSENFEIFWQNHPKLKQISSLGSEIVKIFACGALKSSTYQWKLIIFDEFGTKFAPEGRENFLGLKNLHFVKTNKKHWKRSTEIGMICAIQQLTWSIPVDT